MTFALVSGLMACATPKSPDDDASSLEDETPSAQEPEASNKKEDQDQDQEIDCSKLESTGLDKGDVAPNLVLENGEGRQVRLHDYCNDTVILIASEY